MMLQPEIESYESDEGTLYEIIELTPDALVELENHFSHSPVRLSPQFQKLHRDLKILISSLDRLRTA